MNLQRMANGIEMRLKAGGPMSARTLIDQGFAANMERAHLILAEQHATSNPDKAAFHRRAAGEYRRHAGPTRRQNCYRSDIRQAEDEHQQGYTGLK